MHGKGMIPDWGLNHGPVSKMIELYIECGANKVSGKQITVPAGDPQNKTTAETAENKTS